jgi:hypothetical protein
VCSGSTSFDLSMGVIGGSIEEIGTAAEILSSQADGQTTHSKDSKSRFWTFYFWNCLKVFDHDTMTKSMQIRKWRL